MLVDYVKIAYRGTGATNPAPPASATPSPTSTTPSGGGSASPTASACAPEPTETSSAPPPPVNANQTAVIEAENYAVQQGVRSVVGAVEVSNGDHVAYDLDFGPVEKRSMVARVASGVSDGSSTLVEVRLGSPTAAPIGSLAVGGTGGWDSYRDIPANIAATTGRHRVFLTFKSVGDAPAVNVDKFVFGVTPAVEW